jgi:hypothetical protein
MSVPTYYDEFNPKFDCCRSIIHLIVENSKDKKYQFDGHYIQVSGICPVCKTRWITGIAGGEKPHIDEESLPW